jgi:hypothetical protein
MVLEKRRDQLLVLGIAAVLSARYFYRAKQLRPFQVGGVQRVVDILPCKQPF